MKLHNNNEIYKMMLMNINHHISTMTEEEKMGEPFIFSATATIAIGFAMNKEDVMMDYMTLSSRD